MTSLADLEQYYRFIFPAEEFYRWLSYESTDKTYFSRREFSFTLPGDIYVRYRSFNSADEFREALLRYVPEKIDIGAVYNYPPKNKDSLSSGVFSPQERELVFDIDISDYDDVRFCCKDKSICDECWTLMAAAAQCLDFHLRHIFGFRQLLFVFSGRRGLHCWVCDPEARALTDEARSALAQHLSVSQGSGPDGGVVLAHDILPHSRQPPPPPPVVHLIHNTILLPAFKKMYVQDTSENSLNNPKVAQRVWECITTWIPALKYEDSVGGMEGVDSRPTGSRRGHGGSASASAAGRHPGIQLRRLLLGEDGARVSAAQKWDRLCRLCREAAARPGLALADRVPMALVVAFVYPRLDVNVSRHRNHLLKAPFFVHPGTGNICVPLVFEKIHSFSPSHCVTLKQVLEEYERGQSPTVPALRETMRMFRRFVTECVEVRHTCCVSTPEPEGRPNGKSFLYINLME